MADTEELEVQSPEEPVYGETVGPSKEYKRWLQRIKRARKLRKDWEQDFQVEECEEFYLGKQQKGLPSGVKVVNRFLATIRVTMPGLLFEDPKFLVRPKAGKASPVSREQAKFGEGVLESIAKQDDNLKNAAKLALLQNFFRIAVLKIIYDPKLEPNPRAGMPIYQTDANGNPIMGPDMMPMPMMEPMTGAPLTEPDELISDETYRWEWVDSRNVLLPDDGPDQSKWTWIGEEIEVPLEDAKEDERFPADMRARMKPSGKKPDDATDAHYPTEEEDPDACFRYVECYDIGNKRWYILSEDEEFHEFLLDQPLPEGVEDHPYAIMAGWLPNTGPKPSPWPLPYTQPWLDPQKDYNQRRQQISEGAGRSARKIGYDKTTFVDEDEAKKALVSSKDMEGVLLTDTNRPPVPIGESDINPAIYNDLKINQMDWIFITGQTGQRLTGASSSDTATEATFMENANNMRDAELRQAVVNWLKVAGRKMWQVVKATITLQMYVKIRGMDDQAVQLYMQSTFGIPPEALAAFPNLAEGIIQRFGTESMQPVTREDLQFEADVEIVPGSTKPRNLAVERSQWLEFLTLIANAPQIALSRSLLEETAAKFDFISPQMVDEIHALAITMMQAKQGQAGHGGKGTAAENESGSSASSVNGTSGAVSKGAELQ